MPSGRFGRRRLTRPEAPLKAVIECGNYVTGGFVDSITVEGLYVRLKKHQLATSKEKVSVSLYLAASNGPSILTMDARIIGVDEAGVSLQFRPMVIGDHTKLKSVIAFVTPDPDNRPG
jgi:hypothetical protein